MRNGSLAELGGMIQYKDTAFPVESSSSDSWAFRPKCERLAERGRAPTQTPVNSANKAAIVQGETLHYYHASMGIPTYSCIFLTVTCCNSNPLLDILTPGW